MFISYIILPSHGETYLVRCIEFLYAQTESDFEVIIAENHFNTCSEYIKDALQTKNNFKVIEECNPSDKLHAAAKLIDENAEFVQILESGTTATPHALKSLKRVAEGVDLIIPATIIKTSDGFLKRFPEGWENSKPMDILDAFDYCFRKSLFDKYQDEILKDPYRVESLMDVLLSNNTPFVFTDDVCYYIIKPEFNTLPQEKLDYDRIQIIASNIMKPEVNSEKIKLFTKYIHRLVYVIDSDRCENNEKNRALESLKEFGREISGNFVLNKIFTLNTGIPSDDLQVLDLSGYITLRKEVFRLSDTENSVGTINALLEGFARNRQESIKEIEEHVRSLRINHSDRVDKIEEMREEITAIYTNMNSIMQGTVSGSFNISPQATGVSAFNDPMTEVPYLYATGKLGLKTILKSFGGWFRFKFRRKK